MTVLDTGPLPAEPAPRSARASGGSIPDRLEGRASRIFLRWEVLLLVLAAIVFAINSFASPYFLDPWNLSDATYNFTEKAMIGLAMALLIVSGEIDLSVASIIALASVAMGAAAAAGASVWMLVLIGLGVGLVAGAFNGFLVTMVGLPSIVVTIGTMSLFRGIAFIVLGDQVYNSYPAGFEWFGQGYVVWAFTVELVMFLVLAVIFGLVLQKSTFGRRVYAIGNNPMAARFSGIRVERIKFILFLLTGVMSGLASICLTSRLGSTRPSIATGWELEVVTMVVLGGVAINGGSGTILGVVIAAFVMGLVTFGFGLLNVPGIVMSIFIGLLLIAVIALPILFRRVMAARRSTRRVAA
ncbi:monosaccharide ABC transporter membrane protein, CUT2 family [Faunimonas pinastri]|uniref:Autoinducer 2 import system permease protein LsrD n=1 Tax=Faunimonas pinastri TaxID=1855383 RepID=A0A1H9NU64_9HYPH|nr:ABC transporter permease [Faunimonas pinastri]SER39438.1 monosaccharide ABC transporter membrane protein, CUT2 family [Faunimonas pinastri]